MNRPNLSVPLLVAFALWTLAPRTDAQPSTPPSPPPDHVALLVALAPSTTEAGQHEFSVAVNDLDRTPSVSYGTVRIYVGPTHTALVRLSLDPAVGSFEVDRTTGKETPLKPVSGGQPSSPGSTGPAAADLLVDISIQGPEGHVTYAVTYRKAGRALCKQSGNLTLR